MFGPARRRSRPWDAIGGDIQHRCTFSYTRGYTPLPLCAANWDIFRLHLRCARKVAEVEMCGTARYARIEHVELWALIWTWPSSRRNLVIPVVLTRSVSSPASVPRIPACESIKAHREARLRYHRLGSLFHSPQSRLSIRIGDCYDSEPPIRERALAPADALAVRFTARRFDFLSNSHARSRHLLCNLDYYFDTDPRSRDVSVSPFPPRTVSLVHRTRSAGPPSGPSRQVRSQSIRCVYPTSTAARRYVHDVVLYILCRFVLS